METNKFNSRRKIHFLLAASFSLQKSLELSPKHYLAKDDLRVLQIKKAIGIAREHESVSVMIRNCLICSSIFNDADLMDDAQLTNILILCNKCYLDRVYYER